MPIINEFEVTVEVKMRVLASSASGALSDTLLKVSQGVGNQEIHNVSVEKIA